MVIVPGFQTWRSGVNALSVPRSFPLNPLYVDAMSGDDNNIGSKDRPMLTVRAAMIRCLGLPDWTIRVKTGSMPMRDSLVHNSTERLIIEGWDDEPWEVYGSDRVTVWENVSGPIWRSNINVTQTRRAVIVDMMETIGDKQFSMQLNNNTTTPTTPNEREMGYVAPWIYVHLPNGESPLDHVIEVARRNASFAATGFGSLCVRDMHSFYHLLGGINSGISTAYDNTGYLEVEDSRIMFADTGVASLGKSDLVLCTRVEAWRCSNDGFGFHNPTGGTGISKLFNCNGSYNGDGLSGESSQGASTHEYSRMEIYGGQYNWNTSGGMVSINNSFVKLDGTTEWGSIMMDHNLRNGYASAPISHGGCGWVQNCTGEVISNGNGDITVQNTGGVGVISNTPGGVPGINNIRSINNALPDSIA